MKHEIINEEEKMENLSKIIDEYAEKKHLSNEAVYKRITKIINVLTPNIKEEITDEKGQIQFYEDEKIFLFAFLDELDEPYFKSLINKKPLNKKHPEIIKLADEFRCRVTSKFEKINSSEIKEICIKSLEEISKIHFYELDQELLQKIKRAGDLFKSTKLSYDEHIMLRMELIESVDNWMSSFISKYPEKLEHIEE